MIIVTAFIVAFLTSNPLFAIFGLLWLVFNYLDVKKTDHQINDAYNFITGVKIL